MKSNLVQAVSFRGFEQAFCDYGRNDNFSAMGLEALYDYLQDLAFDQGEAIELDVIALCCEYTEYTSLAEFNSDYGAQYPSWDSIGRLAICVGAEGAIIYNE